ncbi:DUF2793 domain-containing protein [Erythrobacter sp.]|uniref:DUF2793 domain-containing protein n=1 Tax=Erythrobacter sp. TaxID=1042 RepID=UPI001425E6BB|nr:DUF2793 domain-containing protein [Erythrobacter sp.]QIQ87693.1 MAG: DUF2793 domain-containing protein [Erythrobacter sp.]
MTDPITYPYRTEAHGFPLLFAGQAQKEFTVNETICLIDALMTRTVKASLDAPPAEPAEGACYRVLEGATGEWSGKDRTIAARVGGGWHFVSPCEGMQVFDQAVGCWLHFEGDWNAAGEPIAPQGGAVVDLEARAAIAQLTDALRTLGLFSQAQA